MAIPAEFTGFVRDVARRAFDSLAARVSEIETPLRGVVRSWSKLSDSDKDRLIDELIASAKRSDQKPAAKPRRKSPARKRATRSTRPSTS